MQAKALHSEGVREDDMMVNFPTITHKWFQRMTKLEVRIEMTQWEPRNDPKTWLEMAPK